MFSAKPTPLVLVASQQEKHRERGRRWHGYVSRAKPWLWLAATGASIAYCYKTCDIDARTGLPLPSYAVAGLALPRTFQAVIVGSVVMTVLCRVPRTSAWMQRYALTSLRNVCGRHMYWTVWTSSFVHIGPVHLVFNMLSLVSIGSYMSESLPALKRADVSIACFVVLQAAAVAGEFLVMARMRQTRTFLCGFSGVGYALITMFALSHSEEKLQIIFLPFVQFKACHFWPLVLSIDAAFLIRLLVFGKGSGFGHAAHLSGALVGAMLYPLLVYYSAFDMVKRLKPYHDAAQTSRDLNVAPLIAAGPPSYASDAPFCHLWSRDQVIRFLTCLHLPDQSMADAPSYVALPWLPLVRQFTRDWPLVQEILASSSPTVQSI
jgi:membrane associated rhomboid family serine protease